MISIFKIHIYESAIFYLCLHINLSCCSYSITCRGPSPGRLICAEPCQ